MGFFFTAAQVVRKRKQYSTLVLALFFNHVNSPERYPTCRSFTLPSPWDFICSITKLPNLGQYGGEDFWTPPSGTYRTTAEPGYQATQGFSRILKSHSSRMESGNVPIQARRTPAAIAHQADASGRHQEFLTIPPVQTDDNPIILESVEIEPSPGILGPHSLSDRQAFRDHGCVRCPVEVMDSDGAFQLQMAHISNDAHSFITQVFANTLRLQLIPLPPSLGRRSYFASFGKWQPTRYVSMEVRVPRFGITSTKLSVGVLEEDTPSSGLEVTLGKSFIQKTGVCLCSHHATGLGDTGSGNVEAEGPNLPGVTPDVGEPTSTRLPLLTHCGPGRTPVPNSERPSISGPDVGPVDFNRLDPSGWPRTGPSRSTSGIAGTPFTTAVDVLQSSAPTSIALEDAPGKDSKEILDVPTYQGLIDHKNHDGQFFIACLTRPRFVCTAPEDFP